MTTAGRFGVAMGTGVAVMVALGVAVTLAYHPVRPRILCAMPLGTGGYAVYFGYTNEADETVVEPIGSRNALLPAGTPTTSFSPGTSGAFPNAAFVVNAPAGQAVSWTLGPRTVRFDDETLRCPLPIQRPPPEDVAWVPPKPAVVEPPPAPAPPAPEPPAEVAETKPPPKLADNQPKPRDTPRPKEVKAPVALALTGLTNLEGGMGIQGGLVDSLGDAAVEVTEETNRPLDVGIVTGTPDGVGKVATPPAAPKRTAARVTSRPKGQWPADAPPRAGAVLVRLSLLVGVDGLVKQVKVVRGAGPAFDREARAVGLRAVFTPATLDGQPVESWVPWDVEFTPDEF